MKKVIVFTIAALLAGAGPSFGGDAGADAQAAKVKGSKSNTSERVGAQEGADASGEPANAAKSGGKPKGGERPEHGSSDRTTVKSGKSNSSE